MRNTVMYNVMLFDLQDICNEPGDYPTHGQLLLHEPDMMKVNFAIIFTTNVLLLVVRIRLLTLSPAGGPST